MHKKTRVAKVSPSRIYNQQRVRQRRIMILVMAAFALVFMTGMAIWGVCQTIPRFIQPVVLNCQAFEDLLARDFGSFETPSLLYFHTMDSALLSNRPVGSLSHKLAPIMAVGEDTELKNKLEQLLAEYPSSRFVPHLYFYNPQDGKTVEINGYAPVPAASVIKLPILLEYLMTLDEGLLNVDTPLLYADFHRAGGAGELQYRPTGQGLYANDVASQMIRISDNTCTNMMISYLGGTDMVNQRLADLGLVSTRIRNWLPDLAGTNTISPYEMVTILSNIDQGSLISAQSRDNGLSILRSTHNRRLLVSPLPQDVVVAHKTGDIGTALGDSGAVYLPDGRKYFVSMQVERPYNDYTARDMVQRASRMIFDYVSAQPVPQPGELQAEMPATQPVASEAQAPGSQVVVPTEQSPDNQSMIQPER
jgi:beta-lactamase class A